MMRSLKFGQKVALVSLVALVVGCGSTRESAWDTEGGNVQLDEAARAQVAELLAQADAAWAQRGDQAQAKAAVDAWSKAAEIDPIPLSIIDVYTQLSAKHGSIDTVYTSSFGAIALQWYTKLNYGSRIPFTNAIGGLVVSNRFFSKLPDDLQELLKTTGKRLSDDIRLRAREENRKSLAILEKNGIEFMFDWTDANMDEMLEIRDRAAKYLEKTGYIPADTFDRAQQLVNDFRAKQGSSTQATIPVTP